MNQNLLNKALTTTLDLAKKCCDLIQDYEVKRMQNDLRSIDKGAEGISTEADLRLEELVISEIQAVFPHHQIFSEEDCFAHNLFQLDLSGQEFMWVIDPLDGTNNFSHGIPLYSTSIALLNFGKPILGMVANLITGEVYFASEFHQATYQKVINHKVYQKTLVLEHNRKLKEALISPDISTLRNERLSINVRGLRRLGSAALEICYIASGQLDGFWEKGLKPWDIAAGGYILLKAGGRITDYEGNEFHPKVDSVIAARPEFYDQVFSLVK